MTPGIQFRPRGNRGRPALAAGRSGTLQRPGGVALGALAAGLVAVAGSLGCGPSFEAIQEGDLRFAHCDRLDIDPHIAPSHRLHCWREWRRVYTYGQTRDRIEYAQRRIAEVVSGDAAPAFELPKPAAEEGADESRQTLATESLRVAHKSVDRPETRVGAPSAVESSEPSSSSSSSEPSSSSCRAHCNQIRETCSTRCETKPRGCSGCEPEYLACVEGCSS